MKHFQKQSISFLLLLIISGTELSAQWQIYQMSVPYKINFDSTLAGVNSGVYAGVGYSPTALSGSLDSDAWIVHGLSSGDLSFGDSAIGGDYGRGLTIGGVSTGGIYAADVSLGSVPNYALAVQPGGSDFTPGFHLLRSINMTGDTVGLVDISYQIYTYNDQNRSGKIEFYWGHSPMAVNHISHLDFFSPDTAEVSPQWRQSSRSFQIPATLLPGDTLYLKWYSNDFGGYGSRDELALDDIELKFLPPINQPPNIQSAFLNPLNPGSYQQLNIIGIIQDDQHVDSAYVIWGNDSLILSSQISMQALSADSFITSGSIPGQPDSSWIYFKVIAMDGATPALFDSSETFRIQIIDPLAMPQNGDIIITELMINPSAVSDSRGEYVELYNSSKEYFDLQGLIIADSGHDSAVIGSSIIMKPRQFIILSKDSISALNGGFQSDYQYTGFTLSNLNDEVYLLNSNLDTIDKVEYNGGSVWLGGAAITFRGSARQDNNNLMLWAAATKREAGFVGISGDYGSPGTEGFSQVVDHLVFVDGAWSEEPDSSTGHRHALVRSGEMLLLGQDAKLNELTIEPLAGMETGQNKLEITDTLFLLSDSTGSSRLMGEIEGRVCWQSHLKSGVPARWFNVSIPLITKLDSLQFTMGGVLNTLNDVANDTGMVNIWRYDASLLNNQTGEGTWLPVSNKQVNTLGTGFSLYAGAPHFGVLPQRIQAVGEVAHQNVGIPLDNLSGAVSYNFVGNPFPSLLDWDEVVADNPGLGKTYFVYDDGPDSVWVAYNSLSGTITGSATNLISPGQAFFINANGRNQLDVELDAQKISGHTNLFRSVSPPGILMKLTTGQHRHDQTYLGFLPFATDTLDRELDAIKRMNYARLTPSIYSVVNDEKYMYNFIEDVNSKKSIHFEIDLSVSTFLTLDFELLNIDPSWSLELEDLSSGLRHDLRSGSLNINHLAISGLRKFILHINRQVVDINSIASRSLLVFHQGQLVFEDRLPEIADIMYVSDITGRIISRFKLIPGNRDMEISLGSCNRGMYIISILDTREGLLWSKKIML